MKIENKKKILNFSKDFVVCGSKEDLLRFEQILQFNGVENDKTWNEQYRKYSDCIFIYITLKDNYYSYHNHDCELIPVDVETFLTY